MADGVGDLAGQHESRPARETITSRHGELGVDERRRLGLRMCGMVGRELGNAVGVTPLNRAEQVLGLTPELTQVGMHGKVTLGHGQPPWYARCPLAAGEGGS
jgi:hypothetical protein